MNSRFTWHKSSLKGLVVVERMPIMDSRGFLERLFCCDEMNSIDMPFALKQINRTLTRRKGVLRGLHFQRPPYCDKKVVTCLRGKIFDVAVDLRVDSISFGQWHGEILSESNKKSLVIPEGFAHGFQTLTEDCELLYFHSETYHPEVEGGINALDKTLAIEWPLPVSLMSERDRSLGSFSKTNSGINL